MVDVADPEAQTYVLSEQDFASLPENMEDKEKAVSIPEQGDVAPWIAQATPTMPEKALQ